MNDIIREALESYKSLAEGMHDTVCQSFSDDVDRAIKAIAALDSDLSEHGAICVVEFSDFTKLDGKPKKAVREVYEGALKIGQTLYARPPAPNITAEDAALLMELMQAALQGEQLALLGRLSEHELYNKLATLTGNKETV